MKSRNHNPITYHHLLTYSGQSFEFTALQLLVLLRLSVLLQLLVKLFYRVLTFTVGTGSLLYIQCAHCRYNVNIDREGACTIICFPVWVSACFLFVTSLVYIPPLQCIREF